MFDTVSPKKFRFYTSVLRVTLETYIKDFPFNSVAQGRHEYDKWTTEFCKTNSTLVEVALFHKGTLVGLWNTLQGEVMFDMDAAQDEALEEVSKWHFLPKEDKVKIQNQHRPFTITGVQEDDKGKKWYIGIEFEPALAEHLKLKRTDYTLSLAKDNVRNKIYEKMRDQAKEAEKKHTKFFPIGPFELTTKQTDNGNYQVVRNYNPLEGEVLV